MSVLKFVFFVFWKLREFQLEDPGDQSPSCPPAARAGERAAPRAGPGAGEQLTECFWHTGSGHVQIPYVRHVRVLTEM